MGQIYFTNEELQNVKENYDGMIHLGHSWYTEKELTLFRSIVIKINQEIATRESKKSIRYHYKEPAKGYAEKDSVEQEV